jgi:hypothetical protein
MSMTVKGEALYSHFANINRVTQDLDISGWGDLTDEDRGTWEALSEMVVWRQSTSGSVAEWAGVVRMIDGLRAGEGSSVDVLCENPEGTGPDNHAVDVFGEWTDWCPRRFYGQTLHAALAAAVDAKDRTPKRLTHSRLTEFELDRLQAEVKRIVDRSPAPYNMNIRVLATASALWAGIRGLWQEGG